MLKANQITCIVFVLFALGVLFAFGQARTGLDNRPEPEEILEELASGEPDEPEENRRDEGSAPGSADDATIIANLPFVDFPAYGITRATWLELEEALPALKETGVDTVFLWGPWERAEDVSEITAMTGTGEVTLPVTFALHGKNYLNPDPDRGSEEEFLRLIATAHSLDLKVIAQLQMTTAIPGGFFFEEHPDWILQSVYEEPALFWPWATCPWGFVVNKAHPDLITYVTDEIIPHWINVWGVDGIYLDSPGMAQCDLHMAAICRDAIEGYECLTPVDGYFSPELLVRAMREKIDELEAETGRELIFAAESSVKTWRDVPERYIAGACRGEASLFAFQVDPETDFSLGRYFDWVMDYNFRGVLGLVHAGGTVSHSNNYVDFLTLEKDLDLEYTQYARFANQWNNLEGFRDLLMPEIADCYLTLACTAPGRIIWIPAYHLPLQGELLEEVWDYDAEALKEWYTRLIALKREHPALRSDEIENALMSPDAPRLIAYNRWSDGECVTVIVNAADRTITATVATRFQDETVTLYDLLSDDIFRGDSTGFEVEMSARSARILAADDDEDDGEADSKNDRKQAPRIESVSPDPYMPGRTFFTITGSGFEDGATVKIASSAYGESEIILGGPQVEVVSATEIRLNLLAPGETKLWFGPGGEGAGFTVQNPGGETSNTFTAGARPMTLHVIFHTHLDIGFNGTPFEVADRYKRFYDDVVEMIENDDCEDDDGKVRFTVETIWQVEQFIDHSTPEEIERFFELVREGRIEVCAGYDTPNTSALSYEDLGRLFYPAAEYRERYDIPIETLIFNDQPGYTWAVADVATASGIKYFLTGVNLWHGRAMPETPFPVDHRPFYWVGRTGDRLLTWPSIGEVLRGDTPWNEESYTWLRGGAYGDAIHDFGLYVAEPFVGDRVLNTLHDAEHLEARVLKGLTYYANRDYAYEHLLLMATSGDNDWGGGEIGQQADAGFRAFDKFYMMTEAARCLNDANCGIRVRLDTPTPFFELMVERYDEFPYLPASEADHGGDWPSCWESADAGSPRCMARIRRLRDFVPTIEKIASMNEILGKTGSYPAGDFDEIWRLIRIWDGHTSPGNTINSVKPGLLTYEEEFGHAEQYVQLVEYADSMAGHTAESEIREFGACLAGTENTRIVVFNPTGWPCTGAVTLDVRRSGLYTIIDPATEEPVPFQRSPDEAGRITFIARDVPANGYRIYEVVSADMERVFQRRVEVDPEARQIENEFYRITLDQDGYITEVFDKELERDIIDHEAPYGFAALTAINRAAAVANAFDLDSTPHSEPDQPLGDIRAAASGVATASLIVERPDAPQTRTEIRLYADEKRIDFNITLDPEALELVEYHNTYATHWCFTFPFALDHEDFQLRLDTASGFLDPFTDGIPGTYNDHMFALHGLCAADETMRVEIGCAEQFIWDLPDAEGQIASVGGVTNGLERPRFTTLFNWFYGKARPHLTTFRSGPPDPGDQDPDTEGYQAPQPSPEPGMEGPLTLSYTIRSGLAAFDPAASAAFLGTVNNPMIAFTVGPNESADAELPFAASLIKADLPNVEVTGFKQARSGEGFVVRLREVAGTGGTVTISSDLFDIDSACQVNLVEEPDESLAPVRAAASSVSVKIRPYEMLAVLVEESSSWFDRRE